jgi:UDP-N-acetylmuramoylalanine--D-glutamate ligase
VAPGVPPGAAPYRTAAAAGLEVVSEVDLGVQALPRSASVAITGTNGKTTTTSLTAHLMAACGFDAVATGNIGLPVCEVARRANPPAWLALEVSSFQLHDCPHLRPAIAVLTNLAPNHLDRYATLEEYYADKALLFRNAGATSVTVSNLDDEAVQAMVRPVPGAHLRFSVRGPAEGWYDRDRRTLVLGDRPLLPRDELPLLGDHNVANALAAALAVDRMGGSSDRIAEGLRSFRAIPHRVEPIREVDGVLWVNESKSTNVTATEVAIAAMDRPFVLLLGGRHKGAPYTPLVPLLRDRCRAVVAYGEAEPIVAADLGGAVRVARGGRDWAHVVETARSLARPGDAVLLSPACSSFDMFANYEERGARFRAAVEAFR